MSSTGERDERLNAAEARLASSCRECGLSPRETECVLLSLVDGMQPRQIRLKLRNEYQRTSDVVSVLEKAAAKLNALSEVREAAHEFERALIPCAENKAFNDEREPGLCGVTPDRCSDRFQGGRIVTSDDVRQEPRSAVRLWWQGVRTTIPYPVSQTG